MSDTYWRTFSRSSGDGFHAVYTSYYKQRCRRSDDTPVGEPVEITYSEYIKL